VQTIKLEGLDGSCLTEGAADQLNLGDFKTARLY
jgi:hypothetical protein